MPPPARTRRSTATVAAREHARHIVLPGLRHHAQTLGYQRQPHVLRHGLEPLPGVEELAQRVGEHLAVGGGGKRRLIQHPPLVRVVGAWRLTVSGDRLEEIADAEHSVAPACTLSPGGGLARAVSHERLGERLVIGLKALADRRIILVGEP